MKRKQAKTYNMGHTSLFLSREDINRVRHGEYPKPVSMNISFDIIGGMDYSYGQMKSNGNKTRPKTFRKVFSMLTEKDYVDGFDNDAIYIGLDSDGREVWYFFGYRIAVEFFDTNAVVEFMTPMSKKANLAYAFGKFLVHFSQGYQLKVLNERLISIIKKKTTTIHQTTLWCKKYTQ